MKNSIFKILSVAAFLVFSFPINVAAQNDVIAPINTYHSNENSTVDENKIFTIVDEKSQYPGGEVALLSWINSNVIYPTLAQEEGIEGRVIVSFIVEKDGSISDVKVSRGRHPDLDREAIRVVKKIPEKFKPAKIEGEVVRYKYIIPVTFKLQK